MKAVLRISSCSGWWPSLFRPCKTRVAIYSWVLSDPHLQGVKGATALKWDHFAGHSVSQAASLLAAGVIALQATPAMALNAIELQDQRQTNKNGLQLIYEVRARPI